MTYSEEFKRCRDILLADQSHKTWSLIVTFFGDMAPGQNDKISGTLLASIGAHLNVKAEAMRVALHRLRKDKWIDSIKSGRRSSYFLTAQSRKETRIAAARIYATQLPPTQPLQIVISPEKDLEVSASDSGLVAINNTTAIGLLPEQNRQKHWLVATHEGDIPSWAKRAFCPDDLEQSYNRLLDRLALATSVNRQNLSPVEIAALRVLVVHEWRRIVLRHGPIPERFFPETCHVQTCLDHVIQILDSLARPDIEILETESSQLDRSSKA